MDFLKLSGAGVDMTDYRRNLGLTVPIMVAEERRVLLSYSQRTGGFFNRIARPATNISANLRRSAANAIIWA